VVAHDIGRAINPTNVEGQLHGGILQGLGYALTEGVIIDEATGRVANLSFTDYKIFTAVDMPKIEVILVNTDDPTGPFGAKSVGEMGMVTTAPAVANAIYHAIGVQMKELPMTPERVLEALREKDGKT